MIQEIITFIIVALAVAYVVYRLYMKYIHKKPSRGNATNSVCADCDTDCGINDLDTGSNTSTNNCC